MSQTSKRVLVTGVSGQDGSYMVDYLLAHTDHLVYGMVRRSANPNLDNLEQALSNPRFQIILGDLSDTTSIDNVVRKVKPDYFINLAAQSFVKESWNTPENTFDVDAMGVIRCLEAVRKHVPHCRFYAAGSSEQWGDVIYSPQDEKHPMRPRSPYGAAKCASHHIVKVYRESYGLYAVQGLLLNHESPRRGAEFLTRKVTLGVARIAKAIRDGQPFEPIEIGNLEAKRDWSHAEDFVEGIWRMVNQEKHHPELREVCDEIPDNSHYSWREDVIGYLGEYVLSSNETHTVREFVERAFAAAGLTNGRWFNPTDNPQDEVFELGYLGHAINASEDGNLSVSKVEEVPGKVRRDPSHVSGLGWNLTVVRINPEFYRPAEVNLLLGDSTRARTELGWSPKHSFQDLVTEMVRSDCAALGVLIPAK